MRCSTCGGENPEEQRFCGECGARLERESRAPESVGDGRYRLERPLGEGSRKRVYVGRDVRLDRDVAVAVIKTEGLDDVGRHRIDREARAMARLGDHPNIVTVFDVGDDDGQPYIVSELMPGGSVADALGRAEGHRLAVDDALRITREVALALVHAHAHGVVHRDLKPANVWLAADGTARLGDFGLAVDTARSRVTSEGMVVGTVAYLAPEQAVGRTPDARSDLYSLGACLYEMLTGRPPFLGDDAVTVISQHLNTVPVAPSWHNASVPPSVEALVLALLQKDPAARPGSASDVVGEIERLRERSLEAVPTPQPGAVARVGAGAFGRFVGRAGELDALKSRFDDTLSGRARLVMVVGEPGIGKTRLVEELGVYAAVRGAQVCWGHCYEGELGVPYLPFVEALRAYVRDRSDDELRSELGSGAPEVATLVSDLRERLPGLAALPPLDAEAERLRLFEGVTTFLRQASAARPLVLMLDDLHWADKPTLLLLQYLARNLRRDRLFLVAMYRDVELDRTHPLAAMVAALRREQLYERILLRGLERAEVKAFIDAVGDQETPDALVETIHRETEGNPFFVSEILRNLTESGAISRVDGQWTGSAEGVAQELPEGVREVIGRRLTRLSRDCNRMLAASAAMPNGFALDVVRRVVELSEDQALDLLDEALDAQIVRERRTQRGTYEFTHALIRQTLYSELSTPRRVRLHRQILEALETIMGGPLDAQLTELAYHAFHAAPGGDVAKAVDYATRAATRAAAAAAHEEAARSYDLALQALDLDPAADEHQRAELLLAFGNAARRAGDNEPSREALVEAAAIGRRLDDPELVARAAFYYTSLRAGVSVVDSVVTELCDAALAYGDRVDTALRARVLAAYAQHVILVDAARHAALAAEAVECARRSGDPGALARALNTQYSGADDGTTARSRASYLEIAQLAEAAGDVALQEANQSSLCISALYVGDREQFDADLARFEQLAVASRSPVLVLSLDMYRLEVAALEGRYADADALSREIRTIAHRIGDPTFIQNVGAARVPVLRERGELTSIEAPTRRLVETAPEVAAWRAGLALTCLEDGRLEEAATHLDAVSRDDFTPIGMDFVRAFTLALFAEIAAALGARDAGARLYELLAPQSGCSALIGPVAFHGAVDRYLGLLATMLEHHDNAVAHHEAAIAFHQRLRARPWVARSTFDLACALIARSAPGDRERALGSLNDALDTANTIGMTRLVQDVLTAKLGLQGVTSGSSVLASIDVVAAGVSIERPDLYRHAASDGTVTVLFSDIEGYTALNERLGDLPTQQLLRAHDALIRENVIAHRGTVVKSQGDGYMIVFAAPTDALACAVALQRAIDGHDFGAKAEVVRDRIGLHVGEVIRENDDFFGRTVIFAARIAALAGGGEIFVSDRLRRIADMHPETHDTKWGTPHDVTLKGLTGTHRIHMLTW